MNEKLNGIFVPAATAFNDAGDIDTCRLAKNYAAWGKTAVSGFMVLGTNGECKQLSDDESLCVVETAVTEKHDKTLIVGIGRESLHQTLHFLKRLSPFIKHIDYVSAMTPHFFAKLMTDDALYGYYVSIAEQSPVPVLLYMAPSYANGVVISDALALKLAEHPNIAGIKDTSKDRMEPLMEAFAGRDDFCVLAGSISNLMTCLENGGKGGVVSAANYFPDDCARIASLFTNGDVQAAKQLHEELVALIQQTGGAQGIASLKACMALMGYDAGAPRLPVLPLGEKQIDDMKHRLHSAGKL